MRCCPLLQTTCSYMAVNAPLSTPAGVALGRAANSGFSGSCVITATARCCQQSLKQLKLQQQQAPTALQQAPAPQKATTPQKAPTQLSTADKSADSSTEEEDTSPNPPPRKKVQKRKYMGRNAE